MSDQSGARVRSPDGRWEWDGQAWRPVAPPGATPPPGSSAPVPSTERKYPSPPPIGSGGTDSRQQPLLGALSPDGSYVWDGARWSSAVSADGRWRWTGTAWEQTTTAQPVWATRPFASPEVRRDLAIMALSAAGISLMLGTAGDAISIAIRSGAAGRSLSNSEQQAIGVAVGLPAILFLLAYIGAAIAVPMWCHRVYRNLSSLGAQSLSFSPGWAAGAWFVPVLSIWRPYEVLREVWQNSRPKGESWTLLKVYWAAWLIGNWLGTVTTTITRSTSDIASDAVNLFINLVDLVAAVVAILVVLRVTRGQLTRIASHWPGVTIAPGTH
jgi:Domain of unknown function (DUF4328)